jgi:nitrate/nitrite transporter NarK
MIVMTINWTAATFCYYLVGFLLKYFPGNIYLNTNASAFADIIATLVGGWVFDKIGPKYTLLISYSIGSVFAFLIIIWGWNAEENGSEWTLPILVMLSKFGISSAFCAVYLGNSVIFPTLFTGQSIGFCNLVSRTITISAPFIAEIEGLTPMIILFVMVTVAAFANLFMKKPSSGQ